MEKILKENIESLRKALTDEVALLKNDPRFGKVVKLVTALNSIEEVAGHPKTAISELLGVFNGNVNTNEQNTLKTVNSMKIRSDEFFGKGPLEAAKIYLKKIGQAVEFNDIVQAIKTGGCEVRDMDKLRLGLSRSVYDIAKVGDNSYGLLEFYPAIKADRLKRFHESRNRKAKKKEQVGEETIE